MLQRIDSPPDLSEQVYRQIREAICSGNMAAGARLTQEELAASLNVSRQPVLQALRLLKKDGFVVDAGRRGLRVAPLEAQAVQQLYDVRSVLDGLAARLAAQRGVRIDAAVIAAGREAAASKNVAAMIEADMKFHELIYAASANPLIAETAHRHWQHVRRAMGAVLRGDETGRSVWREHAEICDAINRGDATLAERLAREHCERAGRGLATQLDQHLQIASPARSGT